MGLGPVGPHPLGNTNQFHPFLWESQGSEFISARGLKCYESDYIRDSDDIYEFGLNSCSFIQSSLILISLAGVFSNSLKPFLFM